MSEIKKSKFIKHSYYVVPLLLVLYVLSIGPAAALLVDSKASPAHPVYEIQFNIFYAPVIILASSNQWLASLVIEYVNFCKRELIF